MIYIVNDRPTAYFDGIETLATDTVEDSVWDVYCTDRSTWQIENGKFVAVKPFAEIQAIALNKKYIPDENKSAAVLLRAMLKTTPLSDDDTKVAVSGLYEQTLACAVDGT